MSDVNEKISVSSNLTERITLLDLMIVAARYKRRLFLVPFLIAIVAGLGSYLVANVYMANVKILPPQQAQSGTSALLAQLGGFGGGAGLASIKSPNDLYIGMLRSRTIADNLISQFDLKKKYEMDSLELVRKRLATSTLIASGKDGIIVIEVEDESKKHAMLIANAYVFELMKLTKVLAVTEAAQRRLFYEEQLEASKNNLAAAEIALKRRLDDQGIISVEGESKAIVETVARLKAQISMKEIQLNSMRAFVTNSNPEFLRVNEELTSLRIELNRLENGRNSEKASDALASTKPGLESIKLVRDLKYYQMMYELLAKQYELARLDEAKDPAVVQILDKAAEPERKIRPKRMFIVMAALIIGFLLSIIWTVISEVRRRSADSSSRSTRWDEFRSALRN